MARSSQEIDESVARNNLGTNNSASNFVLYCML